MRNRRLHETGSTFFACVTLLRTRKPEILTGRGRESSLYRGTLLLLWKRRRRRPRIGMPPTTYNTTLTLPPPPGRRMFVRVDRRERERERMGFSWVALRADAMPTTTTSPHGTDREVEREREEARTYVRTRIRTPCIVVVCTHLQRWKWHSWA